MRKHYLILSHDCVTRPQLNGADVPMVGVRHMPRSNGEQRCWPSLLPRPDFNYPDFHAVYASMTTADVLKITSILSKVNKLL